MLKNVKAICIEGPDNIGKSTQISLLHSKLVQTNKPTQVLHYSGIPKLSNNEAEEYSKKLYNDGFLMMRDANEGNKRHVIADRFHAGEWVYGSIYRNYEATWLFELENKFTKYDFWNNVYLIVFTDDIYNIIKREDGKSFSIDPEIKKKELDRFEDFYNRSLINNKILINIKDKSIDDVHKIIMQNL